MIGYTLLFVWTAIGVFSLVTNRDIFSPVKMYLFSVFFYFADIFVIPFDDGVTCTYCGLLILGLLLAIQESYLPLYGRARGDRETISVNCLRPIAIMLWLLSAVPLGAQLLMIKLMGGLEGYVNTLGMRVIEYRGLGPITMIIGVFPVINMVYFTVGVLSRGAGRGWWLGYCVHASVFILIGLASGSRGALLNNFVLMLIAFHYLRRRVPLTGAVVVAAVILVAASLIGIARNGYKMGDDGLETGLQNSDQALEQSHFHYGLDPLVLVYSWPPEDLQLGLTFMTVFTNPIPRTLWPGKPDTGGVVLTKKYTDDAWDGASNLSTGLIAESVLNFGWWIGIPFGFLLIWIAMNHVLAGYNSIMRLSSITGGCEVIQPVLGYLLTMMTVTSLLCGEFTSSVVTAVVGRLLPLAIIAGLTIRVARCRSQNYRRSLSPPSKPTTHRPG